MLACAPWLRNESERQMRRRYLVYDVFTDRALAGNPLAVVLEADGLDDAAMQAIALEFNLSETVFVSAPESEAHAAALRIFTPRYELPFAGHPTIGTAVALAEAGGAPSAGNAASLLVLEERIGNVRCAVSGGKPASFAEFDLPALPQPLDFDADREAVAAVLGLGPGEIGFENHRTGLWSAGVPYVTVPVASLDALRRVQFDGPGWLGMAPRRSDGNPACAYVYSRETLEHGNAFHARMFVPGPPVYEDPATGSAAAAFAGAVVNYDEPRDGHHRLWIEQGDEMGRPSRIRLELDIEGMKLVSARIGGHAVKFAAGELDI
jgi:trans-2,3-dihydro-3-hydroxyanthranilate isomerase